MSLSALRPGQRILIIVFLITVLTAAAGAASRVYLKHSKEFGFGYAHQHGSGEQEHVFVSPFGRKSTFSYDIASRIGGVILQAEASTDPAAADIALSYMPNESDGHRFRLKINDKEGDIVAPDWEVIPLIKFVNSGQTAAMTLLGLPKNVEEQESYSLGTMFIEIHPAFQDTVLGNNFIFTDAMLVEGGTGQINNVTENFSQPIPGYTDLADFDPAKSELATLVMQSKLSTSDWTTYIFTDVDVKFTVSITDNNLNFTGEPYYAFLNVDDAMKTSEENETLTNSFKNSGLVRDLNPKIYDLDKSAFRIAALLRHVKATNNGNWTSLVQKVSTISPDPTMETPRSWTP